MTGQAKRLTYMKDLLRARHTWVKDGIPVLEEHTVSRGGRYGSMQSQHGVRDAWRREG